MKYFNYILMFFIIQSICLASVKVNLTLDKNSVLIGEPVKLNLKAEAPLDYKLTIKKIKYNDSLYEINSATFDTSFTETKRIVIMTGTFSSLNSGEFIIESMPIIIEKPGAKDFNVAIANKAKITFIDVVADTNKSPKKHYGKIEDMIVRSSPQNSKSYLWIIILIALIVIAFLSYLILKRRRRATPAIYSKTKIFMKQSAGEEDLEYLYAELSMLLNEFLELYLNIDLPESTNDEVNNLLQSKLERQDYEIIRSIKRRIELVNFARKKPNRDEFINDCKQLLAQIQKHIKPDA